MKRTPTTIPRAGLALGCALLACALTADAKKPVPPPPDDLPSAAAYDVVLLGDPGTGSLAEDINQSGLVVGRADNQLTLVVPELENGTLLFAQKGSWTRFGVYVVHTSILIILIGAIIGSARVANSILKNPLYAFKGGVNIPESQQRLVPDPFQRELEWSDQHSVIQLTWRINSGRRPRIDRK